MQVFDCRVLLSIQIDVMGYRKVDLQKKVVCLSLQMYHLKRRLMALCK